MSSDPSRATVTRPRRQVSASRVATLGEPDKWPARRAGRTDSMMDSRNRNPKEPSVLN
jgi:hypothetical protein